MDSAVNITVQLQGKRQTYLPASHLLGSTLFEGVCIKHKNCGFTSHEHEGAFMNVNDGCHEVSFGK